MKDETGSVAAAEMKICSFLDEGLGTQQNSNDRHFNVTNF